MPWRRGIGELCSQSEEAMSPRTRNSSWTMSRSEQSRFQIQMISLQRQPVNRQLPSYLNTDFGFILVLVLVFVFIFSRLLIPVPPSLPWPCRVESVRPFHVSTSMAFIGNASKAPFCQGLHGSNMDVPMSVFPHRFSDQPLRCRSFYPARLSGSVQGMVFMENEKAAVAKGTDFVPLENKICQVNDGKQTSDRMDGKGSTFVTSTNIPKYRPPFRSQAEYPAVPCAITASDRSSKGSPLFKINQENFPKGYRTDFKTGYRKVRMNSLFPLAEEPDSPRSSWRSSFGNENTFYNYPMKKDSVETNKTFTTKGPSSSPRFRITAAPSTSSTNISKEVNPLLLKPFAFNVNCKPFEPANKIPHLRKANNSLSSTSFAMSPMRKNKTDIIFELAEEKYAHLFPPSTVSSTDFEVGLDPVLMDKVRVKYMCQMYAFHTFVFSELDNSAVPAQISKMWDNESHDSKFLFYKDEWDKLPDEEKYNYV